jgi:hypothetical protein
VNAELIQVGVTSITSVLASSGLWAWLQKKDSSKDATARLLMGMAYDRITTLGVTYIERGWITRDELEDFQRYFYNPYKILGGNGVAERIMNEVLRLPLKTYTPYTELVQTLRSPEEPTNVRLRVSPGPAEAPAQQP